MSNIAGAIETLDVAFSLPFFGEPNGVMVIVTIAVLAMFSPVLTALLVGKRHELRRVTASSMARCLVAVIPVAGALVAIAWMIRDHYKLIASPVREE